MGRQCRGFVEVVPMPNIVLLALAAVVILMSKHAVTDLYLQTPINHKIDATGQRKGIIMT
jgi:hypothetical protein